MQGQDDRSKDALRSSRQFQPSVDQPLEKRDLPATLAGVQLSVNSALAGTPLIGAAKAGKSISANDWNSFAGWSWLKGVWKSNTKIDFMQAVAKSMGGKSIHFPSVPSLDTWLVGGNMYIGRTALAAQQNTDMPLDGLVIKPATNGGVTTLSMTSADGTPPVELKLTSTTSTTATFTGKTPADSTSNSDPVNVRVVITKRNTNSLRIIAEMQTGSSWVRMFTYTATRTKFTAV